MTSKTEVSGYGILLIGVGLLVFSFLSAYLFLSSIPAVVGSSDLVTVFGVALAPLIETCIRIMYLGIMGWIGSLLTIRGIQLLTQPKRPTKPEVKSTAPDILQTITPETTKTLKAGRTRRIGKAKSASPSS